MNKLLILFLVFCLQICNAQSSATLKDFLKTNYLPGPKAFLINIYENIKFPIGARTSCTVGKLKMRLVIHQDGFIEKVQFLNMLGNGLEEEAIRVMQFVKKDWLTLEKDTTRVVDLTIAWQIGTTQVIKGDINLVAEGRCNSNAYYLRKLEKMMKKEKYEKAKLITIELLKRDPDSSQFRQLDKVVTERMKSSK